MIFNDQNEGISQDQQNQISKKRRQNRKKKLELPDVAISFVFALSKLAISSVEGGYSASSWTCFQITESNRETCLKRRSIDPNGIVEPTRCPGIYF